MIFPAALAETNNKATIVLILINILYFETVIKITTKKLLFHTFQQFTLSTKYFYDFMVIPLNIFNKKSTNDTKTND